jgi:hypothetical protein
MQNKRRPLGEILLELEFIYDEMVDDHELQMGDILALTHMYLQVHRPDCIEKYTDGGIPIFYYGSEEEFNEE